MKSEFLKSVMQWEFDWEGRKAKLPVFYYDNTALTAIYTASTAAVRGLLPHPAMRPIELYPGRCLAVFTTFEYRETGFLRRVIQYMLVSGVRMSLRFGAVVLLMAVFVSNVASAQASFVSQDRSIYYHRSGTCYFLEIPTPFEAEDGTSAPDFEPFEAQLSATWIDVGQSSLLEPLNISASGAVDVDAEHTGDPLEGNYCIGQADGYSTFQVEFFLLEPSQFQISARVDVGTTWGEATAWVRLNGPGGVSIFDVDDYPLPEEECEFYGNYSSNCAEGGTSGVLQPGHYVLEAHASGDAATWPNNPSLWEGYADATYTVTLAMPRGVPALSGRSAGLLGLVLLASGVLASSQIRTRKRGRW